MRETGAPEPAEEADIAAEAATPANVSVGWLDEACARLGFASGSVGRSAGVSVACTRRRFCRKWAAGRPG